MDASARRIRVFICAPYELWAQLLADALAHRARFEIAGYGARAPELRTNLAKAQPQVAVVVLDPHPHDWPLYEFFRLALGDTPHVVVAEEESASAARILRAGAKGYVDPAHGFEALARAIRRVHAGELAAPGALISRALGDERDTASRLSRLTPQELRILHSLAGGKRNKEIAADLAISEATVKSHLNRIYKKLNLTDRLQAALFGARNGLSEVTPAPRAGGAQARRAAAVSADAA